MPNAISIRPTPPQRQAAALELLFSGLPPDERAGQIAMTLGALAAGKASTAGLLEAISGEQALGVVWASPLGGKAALVWPPQVIAGAGRNLALGLLAAVESWMRHHDLQLATAFLTDQRGEEAERFRSAGYVRAAEVLYLASQRGDFPDAAPPTHLSFQPFDESQLVRLTALVEQTYSGTLDCPLLNGTRQTRHVIEGYQATGVFDPSRWLLVRHEGSDVGCLLLADHPQQNQWELVYMGLIPSARGHGWGAEITRHAQWLAQQAGRSALVLAVDAANAPALKSYNQAGFRTWDRRYVLLKQIATVEIAAARAP